MNALELLQLAQVSSKMGHNMRMLASEAATQHAVEKHGYGKLIEKMNDTNDVLENMQYGARFARQAVDALRNATDDPGEVNPYRYATDEAIAGDVLKRIQERRAQQEAAAAGAGALIDFLKQVQAERGEEPGGMMAANPDFNDEIRNFWRGDGYKG